MTPDLQKKNHLVAYIVLIFAEIFWGISFVWTKELLNDGFDVVLILTVRLIISALILLGFATLTKQIEPIRKSDYKLFFLLAFFEPFLYFLSENYGLKFVDASYAAILIAIIPVIVPFGLRIFYKERITPMVLIGVTISIIGVAIISISNGLQGNFSLIGLILLMVSVLSAVGYNIVLYKLLSYKPITIIIWQNIISAVLYIPILLSMQSVESILGMNWSVKAIFYMSMLAILCSSLAFMAFSFAAKRIQIAKASAFTNLIPIFTIIFALMIGQETITLAKAIGMIIVIAGVFASQIRKK